MTKSGPLFLADTSINHHLTSEDIADITELVAEQVRSFNITPKIALVTYSNFGSVPDGESAMLMRNATNILHKRHPDWIVDGEMQAHFALLCNNIIHFLNLLDIEQIHSFFQICHPPILPIIYSVMPLIWTLSDLYY